MLKHELGFPAENASETCPFLGNFGEVTNRVQRGLVNGLFLIDPFLHFEISSHLKSAKMNTLSSDE